MLPPTLSCVEVLKISLASKTRLPKETKNREFIRFRLGGYHPLWPGFPACSANKWICNFPPFLWTPTNAVFKKTECLYLTTPDFRKEYLVWASPSSLAATKGITFVLFSSRYWDVSLPWVRSTDLLCVRVTEVCSAGFPHSEISGSKVTTHLPEAYRSYVTSFIATLCQGIRHTPLILHPRKGA